MIHNLTNNQSVTGVSILHWCMNHQEDPISIALYRKYLSKNSINQIDIKKWYFVNTKELTLTQDETKHDYVFPKKYKIFVNGNKFSGDMIIVTRKNPVKLKTIIRAKNYLRPIKSIGLNGILNMTHYDIIEEFIGEYDETRLFTVIEDNIKKEK